MNGRRQQIQAALKGIARSYAQLYFSNSIRLGLLLMAVTFFDVGAGLSGLVAICVCQLTSRIFSFSKASIADGAHPYNALMVGLSLGSMYQWSGLYFAMLVLASMLCFFLTVWISGRLAKAGLPFLSLPFLITIWVLLLGLFNFSGVKLGVKGAFSLHQWWPKIFETSSGIIDKAGFSDVLHLYLRSLSAVVFQYNDLAGVIIAIALLMRSRIAFALSIYGFGIGYAFYHFFEGDFTPLIYSYIGFNFILTAIAIGGFFIVPSLKSHLLLLFVIPATALILSALHTVFSRLALPLYSLPFNAIVLLVLGALQMRYQSKGLQLVVFQQYSPELNHYKHIYYEKRFAGQSYYHLQLPVMGAWHVSQGYGGRITHRDNWQHALDFDIIDEAGKSFTGTGFDLKNYYCYELPVLASAAGYVTTVKDGVRDNAINAINLEENWGNTIIIKHAEGLYTKLSHLKPGSIKVKEGDYVQAGELVAACGSSGRSPEPHLHFQAQASPYIGSQTLSYPIAYYLVKNRDSYAFHAFDVPQEDEIVRSVIAHPILANAFDLVPGEMLKWKVKREEESEEDCAWSVEVDSQNRRYLYCAATKSAAYFYNDGVLFYFLDFYGDDHSFLYRFHLSFQKILLGYYKGVQLQDALLPQAFFNPALMAAQDFAAPLFHFLEGQYSFEFFNEDSAQSREQLTLQTVCNGKVFNKVIKRTEATMLVSNSGIEAITITGKTGKTTARCVR